MIHCASAACCILFLDIFAIFDGVEYYRSVGSVKVSDAYEVVSMNINVPQIAESENKEFISQLDGYNNYMEKINELAGTNYKPFNYYGNPEATRVIVAMGSVCETIKETVEYLVNTKNDRVF